MIDERTFIERVEAADPSEFGRLLVRPSGEEERVLRAYFGDARYERLHSLALQQNITRGREKRGNVVVLHGIMGAELTAFDRRARGQRIWVQLWHLARGHIRFLRLDEAGRADHDASRDVRPTGLMKRYYGEQILSLSRNWNVYGFWYDWRKDLKLSADRLRAHITDWFGDDEPVHLVAHSMGGLVARTFILEHADRWKSMQDPGGSRGGRLLMLGTPNFGSFSIPQVITGLQQRVRMLALLDLRHSLHELLAVINSFPGVYQMLPSPERAGGVDALYRAETYGDLNIPQRHLERARQHHEALKKVVDKDRMVYVAGYDRLTLGGIKHLEREGAVRSADLYETTLDGDGQVPHALGLLDGVPTFYVDEIHGSLQINPNVLAAMDDLLETGATRRLQGSIPRGRSDTKQRRREAEQQARAEAALEEQVVRAYLRRLNTRHGLPTTADAADELPDADVPEPDPLVHDDERKIADLVTLGFVEAAAEAPRPALEREKTPPVPLEVALVLGGIEEVHNPKALRRPADGTDGPPVDAISVGHYVGVKPQNAEKALDEALSGGQPPYLLTDYTERGTIRGELGQPFILPDPRMDGASHGRVVVLAGMGLPGRFAVPELVVLTRELGWSMSRLKRRHLATVLIGAGAGNISVEDAVDGWLRGLALAFSGTGEPPVLQRVTFVELNPHRIERLNDTFLKARDRLADDLQIHYTAWTPADLEGLDEAKAAWDRHRQEAARRRLTTLDEDEDGRAPTRITIELNGDTYRFGAITDTAAIPEREIPLDPLLVDEANRELVRVNQEEAQVEHGRFLERLLIPHDLRDRLATDVPLVLLLDATTARIHWEMVAQPERSLGVDGAQLPGAGTFRDRFLGTSRSLTRQLRTTFAPPPEPPPPPRRVLRILVVADPAADARLPGAEEEGVEVADLFEHFNAHYASTQNRVEVTRLLGPSSATRTRVLRELMLNHYDVVHFAGHCIYEPDNPSASGWIFTGDQRLSARELMRIDRVPRFVFSNACESGITPDRSEQRSPGLAASFAEAFFAQGVTNFVCTAWPVDDEAARVFARTLYAHLLGLEAVDADASRYGRRAAGPDVIHRAMREARLAAAATYNGRRTWGAYQHYGNPYYRFFAPVPAGTLDGQESEARAAEAASAGATGSRPTARAAGTRKPSRRRKQKGASE